MSRRKQAKPRSLKRDEEWDDAGDSETVPVKPDEEEAEEEDEEEDEDEDEEEEGEDDEELRHAFNRHSQGYPGGEQPGDSENDSLDSEGLGTGSSSWHSEDGGPASRRGGETPSSCATPTSASFPSEPEADANVDGNNPAAPYPCQFCERTFPRLSYLKKHEQSHGDQMPYRCSWCARLFKHKRSRDRHVKLHTGDRRYRCTHCEAAFSRSDHLKIHMKTHDTQKPYQCTACSRGYNTAAALTSHMQSHKKHHHHHQHHQLSTRAQDPEYNLRSVSSRVQDADHNLRSVSSRVQDPDYNLRSVSSRVQDADPNLRSVSCRTRDLEYGPRGVSSRAQDLEYGSRGVSSRAQDLEYGSRAVSSRAQDLEYGPRGVSSRAQDLEYGPRSVSSRVQDLEYGPRSVSSRVQDPEYGPRSVSSRVQDPDYNPRSVSSHSTLSPPVASSPSPSATPRAVRTPRVPCSAPATPVLASPLKLACMYCTRDSFACMQQLQLHVHTMHQAIVSGESLLGAEKRENSSKDFSKDFSKDAKDVKDFKDARGLKDDPRSLHGALACGQCTMKFSTLESLRDHLLSIHRLDGFGASLMMCPLCGIPCSSTAAYAEHYVLVHCENRPGSRGYPEVNGKHDEQKSPSKPRDEPKDLTKPLRPADTSYTSGTLLCGQCGAALKDFESFREHLAGHLQADQRVESSRYPCPKCEATFRDQEDSLVHLTKHYVGQVTKEYACSACKRLYPHPDLLQRHLLDSHAHHLYRCALCRDTFDSRVAIQVHFAVKHSQECRVYRCNACPGSNNENSPGNAQVETGCVFGSETEMTNHVRSVHAPPSVTSARPSGSPVNPQTVQNSQGPRCVFCGVCCASELDLQLHLASHSTNLYRCPVCGEGFAVEFLLDRHVAQVHHSGEHQQQQQQQQQVARTAGARENGRIRSGRVQEEPKSQKRGRSPASSNNNSLNQRDNNNSGSSKRANLTSSASTHHCDLCERREFPSESDLQAHKKLVHGPSKPSAKPLSSLSMTCAYCGECCRSRSDLESHTRLQHGSNEPSGRHKCNICDEVCPSASILAEHKLRKHCKIQLSDSCVVCRAVLESEDQFLEHVQRHGLEATDPGGATVQQRLEGSQVALPAACVVCRQTLVSDLECRLHARHHLRPGSPGQTVKPRKSTCCLCLRDFSSEELVDLPAGRVQGPNAGPGAPGFCKSCFLTHSRGLRALETSYELETSGRLPSSAGKFERAAAWPVGKENGGSWDAEASVKVDERSLKVEAEGGRRCRECGVKFEDDGEAEKHRISEHGAGSNSYTCIQCQASFSSEAKIQRHVRREHLEASGKGPVDALRCHLCLFEAGSPLQLQSHLIEHTFAGCAALSCYICQALFTAPIGLQNHMLHEHGLGARPYDCSKCSLKFFFRAELDHHSLTFHRAVGAAENPREPSEGAEVASKCENEERRDASSVVIKEETPHVEEEVDEVDQEVGGDNEEVNVDGHGPVERAEPEVAPEASQEAAKNEEES